MEFDEAQGSIAFFKVFFLFLELSPPRNPPPHKGAVGIFGATGQPETEVFRFFRGGSQAKAKGPPDEPTLCLPSL